MGSYTIRSAKLDALSSKSSRNLRVSILYHYMYPDDVVSALHLDGLAQDLAAKGWEVEALPCNRGCRDETKVYPATETHRGVHYRRVWRPGFSQKSFWGRLANSGWMIASWSRLAFRARSRRPDVIIIGTDPVFAAVTAIPLRFFARDIRLVHWCFDMHPEAAVTEGMVSPRSLSVRFMLNLLKRAYRSFDLIADIGVCMRKRLREYGHAAIEHELTPWALVEPEQPIVTCDLDTRRELFGNARIGILYSGNFGEAHNFNDFIALARAMRNVKDVHFCFAIRGNRADQFRQAIIPEDINISFAEFAPIEELVKRLGSADIHLVSLKQEWTGIAVPSKFFGSIASGKPILYSGPRNSAIGNWITKHNIGWIINPDDILETTRWIVRFLADEVELHKIQHHCHSIYHVYFSRHIVMDKWDRELRNLLVD